MHWSDMLPWWENPVFLLLPVYGYVLYTPNPIPSENEKFLKKQIMLGFPDLTINQTVSDLNFCISGSLSSLCLSFAVCHA